MRGTLAGLATPHPLGRTLPGLYQDDDFTQRLCAGLDEVLAPVVATLDGLPAYLDPGTSPTDVLAWLAGWTGVVLDDATPPDRRREQVRRAAELHRWRGTARGVREAVRLWCGCEAEVSESGAAAWSAEPGAQLPGDPVPALLVRVRSTGGQLDLDLLETVVTASKPAHVPHRVEVVDGEG